MPVNLTYLLLNRFTGSFSEPDLLDIYTFLMLRELNDSPGIRTTDLRRKRDSNLF